MGFKVFKRIGGALLACGLFCSLPVPVPLAADSEPAAASGAAAQELPTLADYADMAADEKAWYYDTMAWGVVQGVISGYEEAGEKLLRPERQVTEAEFLAMLLRLYPDTKEAASRLARLPADANWSDPFYKAAALYRVPVTGTYSSDERQLPIKRGQVAQMIASAFGRADTVGASIEFLYEKRLSEGRSGKTVAGFEQEGLLTRAEAVRFLELLASGEGGSALRFVMPAKAERHPAIVPDEGKPLSRLGIYYGVPSLVNGANDDVAKAVQAFEPFDILVFGSEVEKPEYAHYAPSSKIVSTLAAQGKQVYGYVDLGASTLNLSYAEMELAVDRWKRLDVTGIFLDDAGYDYGVTRERQSRMVDYIHRAGLSVFLNAWNPDDVSGDYDENGKYAPSLVREGDWYLAESWLIGKGEYKPFEQWQDKVAKSLRYQAEKGIRVAAVSTAAANEAKDDDGASERFAFVWWAAAMYGIPMQWTDYHYSSTTSKLYYYADLRKDLGFIGTGRPVAVSPNQILMRTNDGVISVHGDGKRYGQASFRLPSGGEIVAAGSNGQGAGMPAYAQDGQGVMKVSGTERSIAVALSGLKQAAKTQLMIHTGDPADHRLNAVHWQGFRADMMVEGNRLYKYTGDGSTWEWSLIRTLDAAGYKANSSGTAIELLLDKADLGLKAGEPRLMQFGFVSDDKSSTAIPSIAQPLPIFVSE